MARGSTFQKVQSLRVGRSVFDLSYEKKFDCDMGQLIPVMCDEAVPGDIWKIGNEMVIRFQPLVAPILHSVHAYVHYFFVPYRLLWRDWEKFITGGVDGDFTAYIPRWGDSIQTQKGGLWDYLGFPVGVHLSSPPDNDEPLVFPLSAYNFIYNEYYRDENLQDPIGPLPEDDPSSAYYIGQYGILNRAWTKDYFTSALPWQQRGTSPALPLFGTTSAEFTDATGDPSGMYDLYANNGTSRIPVRVLSGAASGSALSVTGGATVNNNAPLGIQASFLSDNNTIDLSNAVTFDVSDMRVAFQVQKWLERNARSGARYTEFLRSHFPAYPRDDRLDRPEYIGGSKSPVVISEVLQTSATQSGVTPQANMAGHGITVDRNFCASYHVQEFGLIMGILSVMPRPAYQQGIDRQWLRRTKFDFYFPEFAHLSEQAIENMEIFTQNSDSTVAGGNHGIFGYQGRYDEMRVKRDIVCNNFRDTLDYWHLGRQFANPPMLNESFIQCVPRKDIFAVQDQPGLLVNFANIIKAIRPLPVQSNPGLIDHF